MNTLLSSTCIIITLLLDACVVDSVTEISTSIDEIQNEQSNQLEQRSLDNLKRYGFIGGNYTSISKYPYTVSIGTKNTLLGAGAIINSKWVVTAASVIYDYNPRDLLIRAGSSNSQTGGQIYTVKQTYIHDNYSYYSYYDGNDIALIQVTNPFKFGASVRAVKLANEQPPAFSTTVTSGFGGSYDSSSFSDGILKEAYYQTILIDSCQYYYQVALSDNTFCIKTTENSAPCDLDNGNPFVHKKTLVGLYQYEQASSCDDFSYPPIVTSVAKFTSWINSTIKGNYYTSTIKPITYDYLSLK